MSEPTTRAGDYVYGTSPAERERLLAQPKVLAPEAGLFLDRVGIRPGWRVIDVSCGPIGILDLLAAHHNGL
ncbi:MAG TPA: hypothetical protein VHL09_15260 [Dehalococcoidia bacterium]|nr:hypothetical protein [Dehalococcoidia bacterium]